jgi:hypothetical protein
VDLKIVNSFLSEYVRPEPAAKFSVLGMNMVIYLKDASKPCYPLFSFVQLQGTKEGKAEMSVRIRDGKDLASYKVPLQVKADNPQLKQEGYYNLVHIQVIKNLTFGRPGTFQVIISIDNAVKKTYKLSVVTAKK